MEFRLFVFLGLICASLWAVAEELGEEHVCTQAYCRDPATISLRLDKMTVMDFEVEGVPVAFGRNVNLFPGEDFAVSVTIEDGGIKTLHYDPNATSPKDAISLRFFQDEEEPFGMMLVVKNSFEKHLRYEAFIALPEQDGFIYTSSCPVGPGLSTYESWPYPISHIVLTNVHFIEPEEDDGDVAFSCE